MDLLESTQTGSPAVSPSLRATFHRNPAHRVSAKIHREVASLKSPVAREGRSVRTQRLLQSTWSASRASQQVGMHFSPPRLHSSIVSSAAHRAAVALGLQARASAAREPAAAALGGADMIVIPLTTVSLYSNFDAYIEVGFKGQAGEPPRVCSLTPGIPPSSYRGGKTLQRSRTRKRTIRSWVVRMRPGAVRPISSVDRSTFRQQAALCTALRIVCSMLVRGHRRAAEIAPPTSAPPASRPGLPADGTFRPVRGSPCRHPFRTTTSFPTRS